MRTRFYLCDKKDTLRVVITSNKIIIYNDTEYISSWIYLKIHEETDEYLFAEINHNCVREKKFLYISKIGIKTFLIKRPSCNVLQQKDELENRPESINELPVEEF
jgi:hypothetical protein